MRNFYLIVNREKPRVEEAADLICSFFAEQGCRCIRLDRHDGLRRDAEVAAAYRYTDRRTVPEDTDCVICLGGDGTLIQAARDLAFCSACGCALWYPSVWHQYGASGISDADRA